MDRIHYMLLGTIGAGGRKYPDLASVELYLRWLQEVRRFRPSTVYAGCPWSPGSTPPV
jgi:hypothetical protein